MLNYSTFLKGLESEFFLVQKQKVFFSLLPFISSYPVSVWGIWFKSYLLSFSLMLSIFKVKTVQTFMLAFSGLFGCLILLHNLFFPPFGVTRENNSSLSMTLNCSSLGLICLLSKIMKKLFSLFNFLAYVQCLIITQFASFWHQNKSDSDRLITRLTTRDLRTFWSKFHPDRWSRTGPLD